MKTLLFSDIHANKQAAKEIEALAPDFDRLVCAGDICGYGQDFEYVIDMLIALNVHTVQGNHDRMVLDPNFHEDDWVPRVGVPISWTRERIRGKYLDYVRSLPERLEVGDDLFVIHCPPDDIYCRHAEDCRPLFEMTDRHTIVIGHTHTQDVFYEKTGMRKVVNPGSIYMGRRGHMRGYGMLLGTEQVVFQRLEPVK